MKKKDSHFSHSVNTIHYSSDARDYGQVAQSIPCQEACPAKTNIPGYIRAIHEQDFGRAYEINRKANILPGVLGRICSRPCESDCRHGEPDNGKSVGICHLKRSCSDLKPASHRIIEGLYSPTDKNIAVIGSGPAGLAAAHDLAIFGHKVMIYERMEKPGGMMMYGIPEFRLPRKLLMMEINNILRMGIGLTTGVHIGTDVMMEQLESDYDAVVVTTGCVRPRQLNVEGEDLENVHNGLEFMSAVNDGQKPWVGKTVAVIGAGFTAVDCARSAIRLGAQDVTLNIRKTEEYMRIDETEKHEARFERIGINSLVQPTRIIGDGKKVTGIEFIRTRMEEADKPPFRNSVPIKGSEFIINVDSVIAAIGQEPDASSVAPKLKGLEIKGNHASMGNVFATGDFVTGSSDVISAIAGGKACALAVDNSFTGQLRRQKVVRLENVPTTDRQRAFDFIPKVDMPTIDMAQRLEKSVNEVETGYRPEQAAEEAKRCYLCNLKYEIDPLVCIYCSACIDVAPKDCIKMIHDIPRNADGSYGEYLETSDWNQVVSITIDNAACIRCGQCLAVCPMDCISVTKTELVEIDL